MLDINKFLGAPEIHSTHGHLVDHMLAVVHWFMIALAVGWTIFFLYTLWRFNKRRNPKANHKGVTSHASTHLEVMVVVVEVVLLMGFAFPLWAQRTSSFPTGPNVVRIRAVGEQFAWSFHYTGPDNLFGRVSNDLMSSGNPVGVDRNDPNGKDDFFVQRKLTLPLERDVIVQVTSKDVIHGLAPTGLRIQQDAIPGQEIPMWFRPSKIAKGDIVCAQLCGPGHAKMAAEYEIIDGAAFDEWTASMAPAPAPDAAPADDESSHNGGAEGASADAQ